MSSVACCNATIPTALDVCLTIIIISRLICVVMRPVFGEPAYFEKLRFKKKKLVFTIIITHHRSMRMIMAITTNVSLERTNMAVMTSRGLIITMIFDVCKIRSTKRQKKINNSSLIKYFGSNVRIYGYRNVHNN